MEKAKNVYVCLGNFTWSDLGSWASIHEISHKDENNNVIAANAQTYETRNCIIKGSADKLIVVQGLNGYLVGEFGNVVIKRGADGAALGGRDGMRVSLPAQRVEVVDSTGAGDAR